MTEKKALVAVCSFIPFGPSRTRLLLSYFGSARKIWRAKAKELSKLGLDEEKIEAFGNHRKNFDEKRYFNQLNKFSIDAIVFGEGDYPSNLKELDDAPLVLYVKGTFKNQDANAIAVVGSRKMTSYGREVAEKFSEELATIGITIVSGLARGVDTAAHRAALAVHGRTVAVLGCGLDSVYPPENSGLANEIVKSGGALLSEYPLGHPALPINFASRNRIISGLSKGVLVVEGAEKSGTLLTASHAAEQGRPVFAIPGQITSPLSGAPLFLIKSGAKMVTSVSDILEELDISFKVDKEAVEAILPSTKEEEILLDVLENEPLHLDEIVRISSIATSDVSARLTVMELKGLVKNLGGGIYKKL